MKETLTVYLKINESWRDYGIVTVNLLFWDQIDVISLL